MAIRAEEVAFRSFVDEAVPCTRDAVHRDREALAARIAVMEDEGRDVSGIAAANTASAEHLDKTRFGPAPPFDDGAGTAL